MPNQQHILTLQARVQELQAAATSLAAIDPDSREAAAFGPQYRQLRAQVQESLQACQGELALRQARQQIPKDFLHKAQRAIASTGIKIFRLKHKTFYGGAQAKVADPVQHCGVAPAQMQEVAQRMELDYWLASSCPNLAPTPQMGSEKEDARRRTQRTLLVDAMMTTANNRDDLNGAGFRNQMLQQLPCNADPVQNVTWCEATDAISQCLNQGPLPSFNQRIQAIRNNGGLANRDKVVQCALLMRGCFEWKAKEGQGQEGKDNDFRLWLNHAGPEPGQHSTMNCWEAVYFAAYKAGVMTIPQLQTVYNNPKSQGSAALLGYGGAVASPPAALPGLAPASGDVLFSDTEAESSKHVVLSLGAQNGQQMVMSLWTFETGGTFDIAPLSGVFADSAVDPLESIKTASPF